MRFRNLSLLLTGAALVGIMPPAAALSVPALPAAKVVVTPGLASMLSGGDLTTPTVASVHFRTGSAGQRTALLNAAGLRVVSDMKPIDTAFVYGPLAAIASLRTSGLVDHLQENTKLEYYDDTADWATRTRVLQEPVSGGPYFDGNGNILDGRGIGLAILDSGVDGSHPDLAGHMASNTRFLCVPFVTSTAPPGGCYPNQAAIALPPATNSDIAGGHGTHVAGMAAGDGTASNGYFKGTAPAARIHAFGAGAGLHNLWASQAMATMFANFNSYTPKIRVVNNSYGGAGPYDPLDPVTLYANKLVSTYDVVITFAAGNDGGDGTAATTSSYCRNPTPGVICVANYDEANLGKQDNILDSTSSRGLAGEASQGSWPDLSAPGSFVDSTCARTSGPLCDAPALVTPTIAYTAYYGNASGTSMAAPLVAGGVALLRQANPALTAAAVEDILKDTARKFSFGGPFVTDVNDATRTTSFDKGTGLLDLVAAVQDSRIAAPSGGAVAHPVTLAAGDGGDTLFGSTDIVSATATPGASGVTFTVTLANAADRSPVFNPTINVTQTINGATYTATATLTSATTLTASSAATSGSIAGNVITLFAPYTKLGNPAVGDPAYNAFAVSFLGIVQDRAPGPKPGLLVDNILSPIAVAYTVR